MIRTVSVLAVLASTAGLAHADAPPAPTKYFEVDAAVGADRDLFLVGGHVDGGYALGHGLWAHARVGGNVGNGGFNDASNGRSADLRAGAEFRPCVLDGVACGLAGVDLGVAYDTFDKPGHPGTDYLRAIAVGRVGLDAGSATLRGRLTLDLGTSPKEADLIAVSAGVAWLF